MAKAIIQGMIVRGSFQPEEIACLGGPGNSAQDLAGETGINRYESLEALFIDSPIIVLAFKPHHLKTLGPEVHEHTSGKYILSILAGIPIHKLLSHFPSASNVVRAMPNIPASIGRGVTGYAPWKALKGGELQSIRLILEAMGTAIEVEERLLEGVTGVSGSGVAFVYEFLKALRDGGKNQGLPESLAMEFAQETVLGAALLLKESGRSLEALQDSVVTPGGTTDAGLKTLHAAGFSKIVQDAVAASAQRSLEISKEG